MASHGCMMQVLPGSRKIRILSAEVVRKPQSKPWPGLAWMLTLTVGCD